MTDFITRTQIGLMVIWVFVVISYVLGISLTMANVEKFVVFDNTFSLLSSLVDLASNPSLDNLVLLLVIASFSIVFPIAKLITLFLQIKHRGNNWQNSLTRLVETIGHFSMLDVFIIALMVLLLKLRVLVDVHIELGFYWFTASIITSIVLSYLIKKDREKTISKTTPKTNSGS